MIHNLSFATDLTAAPWQASGMTWDDRAGGLALVALPGDPLTLGLGSSRGVAMGRSPSGKPCPFGLASVDGSELFAARPGGGLTRLSVTTSGAGRISTQADDWLVPALHLNPALAPSALLALPRGVLAVADPDAGRVSLIDLATGSPRAELRIPGGSPRFLAADRAGRMYVASDTGIVQATSDGRIERDVALSTAPVGPGSAGPIAVTDDGRTLYHVSSGSLRSYALDSHPTISGPSLALRLPDARGLLEIPLDHEREGTRQGDPVEALALAWWDDRLWLSLVASAVDSNHAEARLYVFDPARQTLTRVTSINRHIAALAVVPDEACGPLAGRLLVHDAGTAEPVVVAYRAGAARLTQGTFLAGPFIDEPGLGLWHRLNAPGDLPEACRFQLVTAVSRAPDPGQPPPQYASLAELIATNPPPAPDWFDAPTPPLALMAVDQARVPVPARSTLNSPADPASRPVWTEPGTWRAGGDDLADVRLWHRPPSRLQPIDDLNPREDRPRRLWVAGFVRGDGLSTPVLAGLRVESDHRGWERYLPSIYRRDGLGVGPGFEPRLDAALAPRSIPLLDALLGLLEADSEMLDRRIAAIPAWFDSEATPDPEGLARHLGIEPGDLLRDDDIDSNDRRLRDVIAATQADAADRATPRGLGQVLWRQSGVPVLVEEPLASASLWSLGIAKLGGDTQLAPGPAGAARLDLDAPLTAARLGDEAAGGNGDDRGAALWDDLLGRIVLRAYAADVAHPESARALRACANRLAPAYAESVIEVVEPRARLGYQATLGQDAVLARDAGGARLFRLGTAIGEGRELAPARPGTVPTPLVPFRLGRDRLG